MAGVADCAKRAGNFPDAPPLQCLDGVISTIITYAFMFLGVACLIFLFYGAIKFIISQGDPKAVKSARDTMTYAIIGTVLVLSVYIIANVGLSLLYPSGSALFNGFHVVP